MQRLLRHLCQLRQPATHKHPLLIKLLALGGGVKYAEIGRGVGACRGRPLPAAVVRRQVAINQLTHEVALPCPPVEAQIFRQEAGDNHAQPVMHPAGGVKLAHRGIDYRKAGLPALPGLQGGVIFTPGDLISPCDKRASFTEFRIVDHQMAVKLAPDQLIKPGGTCPTVQRGGVFRQQTMQALAR
ncbi:putative deoxiribopirymidine photolyase [Klebsiella variicola CAG:634]|nr:putative deoxiribopirymidine photolyase [Klebsiella variicola CAG:634]